jgi:hypothetical protein
MDGGGSTTIPTTTTTTTTTTINNNNNNVRCVTTNFRALWNVRTFAFEFRLPRSTEQIRKLCVGPNWLPFSDFLNPTCS